MSDFFGNTYTEREQVIGAGNNWVTLSEDTEIYSDVIDMAGYLGAEVAVEVVFDDTPTDDVDVRYYPCDDDTPTTSDTVGKVLVRMDNGTDPNIQTFALPGDHRYIRIGVVQTGSTDSHNVRAYSRQYRVAKADA